jgi:hypothetical protein
MSPSLVVVAKPLLFALTPVAVVRCAPLASWVTLFIVKLPSGEPAFVLIDTALELEPEAVAFVALNVFLVIIVFEP